MRVKGSFYCSQQITNQVRDDFKIGMNALILPLTAVAGLRDMGFLYENTPFNQMQSFLTPFNQMQSFLKGRKEN